MFRTDVRKPNPNDLISSVPLDEYLDVAKKIADDIVIDTQVDSLIKYIDSENNRRLSKDGLRLGISAKLPSYRVFADVVGTSMTDIIFSILTFMWNNSYYISSLLYGLSVMDLNYALGVLVDKNITDNKEIFKIISEIMANDIKYNITPQENVRILNKQKDILKLKNNRLQTENNRLVTLLLESQVGQTLSSMLPKKPMYISDIPDYKLDNLALKISSTPKWIYIGLLLPTYIGLEEITKIDLIENYGDYIDSKLIVEMLKYLQSKNVKISDLAKILRDEHVGLNYVADVLLSGNF